MVPTEMAKSIRLSGVDRYAQEAPDFRSDRRPTGVVRPLEERDLARVAELHERVMPKAHYLSSASLRAYLSRILLTHPWRAESLPSLVFEGHDGRIVGCLGVMPRPMSFQGRSITAAISHSFIVEPGARSMLAALELARAFHAGPQDLSIAEGSSASRRIWELTGGDVSLLYSLCWTRLLQPSRYVLSHLNKRGLSPAAGWMLRPVCRAVDALLQLASRSLRPIAPPVPAVDLDGQTLCGSVSEFTKDRSLRPLYDEHSFSWLLETLAHKQGRGAFHKVVVRNERHVTIGWYMYYAKPGETGAVVQIVAREDCAGQVLDHLFHHARRHGAIAVSGQVDPVLFHALGGKDCLFHQDGGSWLLVHSKHPELLQAIHRGDAFLTRLEGEWWIGFLLS